LKQIGGATEPARLIIQIESLPFGAAIINSLQYSLGCRLPAAAPLQQSLDFRMIAEVAVIPSRGPRGGNDWPDMLEK
jgi:hypothetical protein